MGRDACDNCGAGYFCDGLGTTKDGRPECAVGHYCESYDFYITEAAADLAAGGTGIIEYRQKPCPAGTYNDLTARTGITDCKTCTAGKACEREALSDPATFPDCAAGYFCLSGATSRYPD